MMRIVGGVVTSWSRSCTRTSERDLGFIDTVYADLSLQIRLVATSIIREDVKWKLHSAVLAHTASTDPPIDLLRL